MLLQGSVQLPFLHPQLWTPTAHTCKATSSSSFSLGKRLSPISPFPCAVLYQVSISVLHQGFSAVSLLLPPPSTRSSFRLFCPSWPPSSVKCYHHRYATHWLCSRTSALCGSATIVLPKTFPPSPCHIRTNFHPLGNACSKGRVIRLAQQSRRSEEGWR